MEKIRIPVEYIPFVISEKPDGYIAIVKKAPLRIAAYSGATHWTEWRSPYVLTGGIFVPKNPIGSILGERPLPFAFIRITNSSYAPVKGEGYLVFEVSNDEAKLSRDQFGYDSTIYVKEIKGESRDHTAKIEVIDPADSTILHCQSTSTAIVSKALLVAKIPKGGRIVYKYTSHLPYRGGEVDWSIVEVRDIDGQIITRTPEPEPEAVI